MKYRSFEQIEQTAIVSPAPRLFSASEKLSRWATVLEEFDNYVRLFDQIEYRPTMARRVVCAERSPVAIAFADPALRLQGLNGETYGDAMRFFGIGEQRMHRIACTCHYFHRRIVPSRDVAAQIRVAETRARRIETVLAFFGFKAAHANRLVAAMV